MPMSNLARALICSANSGNDKAIPTLLDFALQQGVSPSTIITRWAVESIIQKGHTAALEAMASKNPKVVNFYLSHVGPFALDLAVKSRKAEMVSVLLRLGADTSPKVSTDFGFVDRDLLLSLTNDLSMVEPLLVYGASVEKSGALHRAAGRGPIGNVRLLIQHGADVNEPIPQERLNENYKSLRAGWTPLHYAAI